MLPLPMYVFKEVTLDLITHLPMTEHGSDNIVTFIDRLSKYTYFVLCSLCITLLELTWVFLVTIVVIHGMLCNFISDCDPYFTSQFWCKIVTVLGCQHALSTIYHQQTDRKTECMHYSVE